MADIFLSYAREDRERAKVLAKALEDHCWTVWWDPQIPPGKTFDQVIETALDEAKSVVVLWSKESIGSDWVKEEADEAKRRNILVPALIDRVNPPLGFRRIHAADLIDWEGDKNHPGFAGLLVAISEIVGPPVIEEPVGARTKISESQAETVKATGDKSDREPRLSVPEQQPVSSVTPPTDGEPDFGLSSVTVARPKRKRGSAIVIGVATLVLLAIGIFLVNDWKKPSKLTTTIPPSPGRQTGGQPIAEKKPKNADSFTNSIGMKFVRIPPGSFLMGNDISPAETARKYGGGAGQYEYEHPQHKVSIEQPFYLQSTEVTQGQWKKVMGDNPSHFVNCGEDCPVEQVSWNDAQEFVKKLNELESTDKYRLPSEAEWEYACRAGTTTEYSFGDDSSKLGDYAWYSDNSNGQPHPVRQKKPNAWGLYDMHGNILEWVEDDWHKNYEGAPHDGRAWVDEPRGSHRVLRGGFWNGNQNSARAASRDNYIPYGPGNYVGFRLCSSSPIF
jgi:formylglycine-generating enzyme required for sulfatase activity